MPQIPLEVLDCAIYLYPSEDAAEAGGEAGGSGFLVAVPLEGYQAVTYYAVTNAHVIGGGCRTVRLRAAAGGHRVITIPEEDWVWHPEGDDLAIAEIEPVDAHTRAIVPASFVDGYNPTMWGVGQETYMVGRHGTHEGHEQNRPTARFGHIAQLPHEPVTTPSGIKQQVFLLDLDSVGGYSGAPVFVYRVRPDSADDPESWVSGFEHRFLGVNCGHLDVYGEVLDHLYARVEPRMYARQNSGVAMVIPAWRLDLLLEDDDVVAKRHVGEQAWIEAHEKQKEAESPEPPATP